MVFKAKDIDKLERAREEYAGACAIDSHPNIVSPFPLCRAMHWFYSNNHKHNHNTINQIRSLGTMRYPYNGYKYLCIVLEYAPGGDLWRAMRKNLSEEDAQSIMRWENAFEPIIIHSSSSSYNNYRQILSGLAHIKKMGTIHGDIK